MPHRLHKADSATMVAPKGCVTVRVGAEGEEQRRFAVPLGHLSHPLFLALLEEAEREYGFRRVSNVYLSLNPRVVSGEATRAEP
jgi:hypothetical protein